MAQVGASESDHVLVNVADESELPADVTFSIPADDARSGAQDPDR